MKIPDESHSAWASFGAPTLGGVEGESNVTVSTLDAQTAKGGTPEKDPKKEKEPK